MTFDKLTPPTPRPNAPSTDVGSNAPTNDTSTTGTGSNAPPQEPPGAEPAPAKPGLWQGLGDGIVDTVEQLPAMVPGSHENTIAQLITVLEVIDGYKKGDAIDAVNVINPMMPVANLGFAVDEGDWYTVGRSSISIGVAIVGMVVARKMGGGGSRVTNGSQVTEKLIRDAMKDAPLKSQQLDGVSLPKVQGFVDRLLSGETPPAIKVDGQMLVDGNHRYIAGRIVGQDPAI